MTLGSVRSLPHDTLLLADHHRDHKCLRVHP